MCMSIINTQDILDAYVVESEKMRDTARGIENVARTYNIRPDVVEAIVEAHEQR